VGVTRRLARGFPVLPTGQGGPGLPAGDLVVVDPVVQGQVTNKGALVLLGRRGLAHSHARLLFAPNFHIMGLLALGWPGLGPDFPFAFFLLTPF